MDKAKFLLIIILVLFLANIYFVTQFVLLNLELKEVQQAVQVQEGDEKSVIFAELFVDKVLSGKGEVSFDDRLKLENAVRDINDQNILLHWQNFVNSKTDIEAQQEAGQLLGLLLVKISK